MALIPALASLRPRFGRIFRFQIAFHLQLGARESGPLFIL